MKIITFYSYKGGVGRTLALVNIANRLAEFGKKVCVLDFDLEAPGLDSKYAAGMKTKIQQGLVDYIHSYSCHGIVPQHIKDYVVEVSTNSANNIYFIPAGDTADGEYWRKLSGINWWNLFYGEDSYGIDFFLHLKQQIEEELNPDYLLIDSRTGITEMSSVTMSILADEVVVLAANNDENMKGCARVLEALTRPENNLLGKEKGIHFVLTRIPVASKPDEITQNQIMIDHKVNIIKEAVRKNDKELDSVNVIHSDRELEKNELCNALYSSTTSSATEYLELYDSLIKNDFTEEEEKQFDEFRHYQQTLARALRSLSVDKEEFHSLVTQLIKKYPFVSSDPYHLLCKYYAEKYDYKNVLKYAQTALKCISGDRDWTYYYLALSSLFLHKVEDARNAIDKIKRDDYAFVRARIKVYHYLWHDKDRDIESISRLLSNYPTDTGLYNMRACYYRYYKQYDLALKDVYRALEINTECMEVYSTLAEIKYNQGDIDEFYRNLELALKYKFDMRNIWADSDVTDIYKNCITDERFINLMKKYNQEIPIQK